MNNRKKKLVYVGDLSIEYFRMHPVWTWWENDPDESLVEPLETDSSSFIDTLSYEALFILCSIRLADGTSLEGLISYDTYNAQVYDLSFIQGHKEFMFGARGFKGGVDKLQELSKWLQKTAEQINPIEYSTPYYKEDGTLITGRIDLREW